MSVCEWSGGEVACGHPATVALRTVRTANRGVRTTVDWDEEDGPHSAQRFCGEHAARLLVELARALGGESGA